MLLKNFYAFRNRDIVNNGARDPLNSVGEVVDVNGVGYTSLYDYNNYANNRLLKTQNMASSVVLSDPLSSYYPYSIAVGNGTNQVAEEDYTLTFIYASIRHLASSTSSAVSLQDGILLRIINVNATFMNNSSEAITITEYGVIQYSYPTSSNPKNFLLTRELLETPLTVQAGETFTLNVKINLEYAV